MSGGHFDYTQHQISMIADSVEQLIINNNSTEINDYGNFKGRQYSAETIEEFEKGLNILKQAYIYAQRIDWLVSNDDNEDIFHIRLQKELSQCLNQQDTLQTLLNSLATMITTKSPT